jgi:hypothetical protein
LYLYDEKHKNNCEKISKKKIIFENEKVFFSIFFNKYNSIETEIFKKLACKCKNKNLFFSFGRKAHCNCRWIFFAFSPSKGDIAPFGAEEARTPQEASASLASRTASCATEGPTLGGIKC